MVTWISGDDALGELDHQIVRLRQKMIEAIADADADQYRMVEVQNEQVDALQRLASIRLDVLRDMEPATLDAVYREVLDLLNSQATFIEDEKTAIEDASLAIERLERHRASLSLQYKEMGDAIDAELAAVQAALEDDPVYKVLLETFEKAAAIADRASQKHAVAVEERKEKSQDYLSDPLFSYLWERGYGTDAYPGAGITRMLDNWVARLCKFRDARLNYTRLVQIPDWLKTHADETRRAAETVRAPLERFEREAMESSSVARKEKEAEALLTAAESVDDQIVIAEKRHDELTEQHARTMAGEGGPAVRAHALLAETLENTSFPDLRRMAAETVTLEDDALVDRLVKLRAEAMTLELEAERVAHAPKRFKEELNAFETLRRKFKTAGFHSIYVDVRAGRFDDAVANLSSGRISTSEAFRRIKRAVRRRGRPTRPGFGGRRDYDEIDMLDVLDVVIDAAGSSGMGDRRTRKRFPTKGWGRGQSSKSGGFRTGGGIIGGGGFKTGGGFGGGGGFKTGGGF